MHRPAFNPQWTIGGPLDNTTITFNTREERTIGLFRSQSGSRINTAYFKRLRKLLEKYPDSPFLLPIAHLFLEDVTGALQLFERARTTTSLEEQDPIFEKYLIALRAFVQRIDGEEEREWSMPEDTFVVSPHSPPEGLSAYFFSNVSDEKVKTAWNTLLSESDNKNFIAERYNRLLAIESNEIEGVFLLGGDSLVRLVKAGIFAGAIDYVLDSPSGKPDPCKVVSILKDFSQSLEFFTGILKSGSEITVDHICRLHAILMETYQISTAIIEDEEIEYFVPPGVYRRRLITTYLDDIDGVVQFTRWQDIPEEMLSFTALLKDCLSSTASPFVKAAWIHSTFARIHPFTDGNGRVARIIASIPLIKAGLPFINVRLKLREEYLKAVFTAQTQRNLQPLEKCLIESMEDSIQYISKFPPPSDDDKQWAQSYTNGSARIWI